MLFEIKCHNGESILRPSRSLVRKKMAEDLNRFVFLQRQLLSDAKSLKTKSYLKNALNNVPNLLYFKDPLPKRKLLIMD